MSNFYVESFILFVGVCTIAIACIAAIFALANMVDKILWWALPTAAKVALKTVEWKIETFGAQVAVWEYNFHNRNYNRHSNWFTKWLRKNAEANMRIAIGHAESRLETLSLLLNGIQQ
jgi:hypothetical protein